MFALEGASTDQPFSLSGEQAITIRDVSISLPQGFDTGRGRQFLELGCPFQVFGNAAQLVAS